MALHFAMSMSVQSCEVEFASCYFADEMSQGKRRPVARCLKGVHVVIEGPQKLWNTVPPVVVFSFHTSTLESVDHDVLRLALINEVRQPEA